MDRRVHTLPCIALWNRKHCLKRKWVGPKFFCVCLFTPSRFRIQNLTLTHMHDPSRVFPQSSISLLGRALAAVCVRAPPGVRPAARLILRSCAHLRSSSRFAQPASGWRYGASGSHAALVLAHLVHLAGRVALHAARAHAVTDGKIIFVVLARHAQASTRVDLRVRDALVTAFAVLVARAPRAESSILALALASLRFAAR